MRRGLKEVLKLLRAFLNAGVMKNGLVSQATEGTPQGGPLSPLLSNLMLDVLDKELERRGHQFVRYADDCNINVRSVREGDRVMASVSRSLEKRLKLKVNQGKSAVARPGERKFLSFSFSSGDKPKRRIAPQPLERFKLRVRVRTRTPGGVPGKAREGIPMSISAYGIGEGERALAKKPFAPFPQINRPFL